jgi:hypothetical protein
MNLEDFDTLKLAQDNPVIVGRMTSPDMVVSLLTEHDSALMLLDKAKTDPKAAGFLLALNGAVTEYNAITGKIGSVGMKHQSLLAWLVHIEAVTQSFMTALIAYANPTVYPHANKTELDFQLAKGTIERVKVTKDFERGECVIITTADCEPHTPQIYERVTYANGEVKDVRIAGFRTVEKEGTYRTHCRDVNNLWIDNAYGVITA